MTLRRNTPLVALVAALLLALPGTASAASSSDVLRDCAKDGQLDKQYSKSNLKKALGDLPTDIDEYTSCREAIQDQLDADKESSGSGGGSGGALPPTGGGTPTETESGASTSSPDDLSALTKEVDESSKGKAPQVQVGDRPVTAGNDGLFKRVNTSQGMPLPLLLALASLGLLALVASGLALRRMGFPGRLASLKLPPFHRVASILRRS
jgi:hypothetical protein